MDQTVKLNALADAVAIAKEAARGGNTNPMHVLKESYNTILEISKTI
jgi:hypothetical protein